MGDCVNGWGEPASAPGIVTGAEHIGVIFSADKDSPSVDDTGEALLSSFSNSVTSKSSRLRSSSALSTTDSTVSAAG